MPACPKDVYFFGFLCFSVNSEEKKQKSVCGVIILFLSILHGSSEGLYHFDNAKEKSTCFKLNCESLFKNIYVRFYIKECL